MIQILEIVILTMIIVDLSIIQYYSLNVPEWFKHFDSQLKLN